MPIYRYECEDCGLVVERIQDTSEEKLVWCPGDLREDEECGDEGNSTLLKRQIGKPNAHFKGDGNNSGFHSVDYNTENPASN